MSDGEEILSYPLHSRFVSGIELAERICVMGVSMNLVTYLVGNLHLSSSKSANVVSNFMGSLHLLAIVGGFLVYAKLGKYTTIAIFATITALVSASFRSPSLLLRGKDSNTISSNCYLGTGMWPSECHDTRTQETLHSGKRNL